MKVVNDMRKNNESIDEDNKSRILSFNYNLTSSSSNHSAELSAALSAVPPDDSWATYQWLADVEKTEASDIATQQLRHDYVYANILELSGKQPEALALYELLQARLKNSSSTLIYSVENAIKRLAAK